MEQECWKEIPEYEGLYEISNNGRVRSLDRVDCAGRNLKGVILKPSMSTFYLCVNLSKNGIHKRRLIHQLVAIVFLNHNPNGPRMVVNHKDGNRINNHIDNIEIVTHRANLSTCFRKNTEKFSSKYPGVSWNKAAKKWVAAIYVNGIVRYLGSFIDEIDAYTAYQRELFTLL